VKGIAMYIPSQKKDVVFTVIIGALLLVLALTWNAKRMATDELEITKFKLSNCEDDLKREKARRNRPQELVMDQSAAPIIDKHNAIMDMLLRRMKNGELSKSMMAEYEQILKR
jgi:hypothetical protein